jgi:hypothetical protein
MKAISKQKLFVVIDSGSMRAGMTIFRIVQDKKQVIKSY